MNETQSDKQRDRKVHVTAFYTSTAAEKHFVAEPDRTVRQVIEEGYGRLGEERRAGDQYFCHAEPRADLTPHLDTRLETLAEQGVCLSDNGHGKVELEIDIDVVPGGA